MHKPTLSSEPVGAGSNFFRKNVSRQIFTRAFRVCAFRIISIKFYGWFFSWNFFFFLLKSHDYSVVKVLYSLIVLPVIKMGGGAFGNNIRTIKLSFKNPDSDCSIPLFFVTPHHATGNNSKTIAKSKQKRLTFEQIFFSTCKFRKKWQIQQSKKTRIW